MGREGFERQGLIKAVWGVLPLLLPLLYILPLLDKTSKLETLLLTWRNGKLHFPPFQSVHVRIEGHEGRIKKITD